LENVEKNQNRSPNAPEQERRAILQLIRSTGIGPKRFFQLYHHFGSATSAVENFHEATKSLTSVSLCPINAVDADLERHEKAGVHLITFLDDAYPPLLKQIKDFPPVLSVRGNISVLQNSFLSIVGSRNASLTGRQFITRLAKDLGAAGYSIASGFARGIDTAAHEASLPFGTVGVLAGGADIIYPEENKALYDQVQENGCIISEMPLGMHPQGKHFPRRNRLISGMSQGVIVTEARFQSGSMITAEYALEQGRDVFAVPGSPMDPRCMGSNLLLKQGAILVTRVEDILDHLNNHQSLEKVAPIKEKEGLQEVQGDAKDLLDLLSDIPSPRDKVLDQLGWSASTFNALCSELELDGHLIDGPQGLVRGGVRL
jgi:DNA processing protein